MNTSLVQQHPTIGKLQISAETCQQIAALKDALAEFADVDEIADDNFDRANAYVKQSALLKKAIEREAKRHTDELKAISQQIKIELDRQLLGLTSLLQPLTAKISVYSTRKAQEREAALAEKRRIEAEDRARRAAEATRIAVEKEAKANAIRERMRIEAERTEAAKAGEPLPPPLLSIEPANVPPPIPPVPVASVIDADLGRVTPRPVVHVPTKVQAAVRTRTVQRLVITDEAAIPMFSPTGALLRKIDEAAIRAALKAGEVIPGAELIEDTTSYAVGG
jgi:hypothetical protein